MSTVESLEKAVEEVEKVDEFEKLLKRIDTPAGKVPFLKDIWSVFSSKGTKTNVVSVNSCDSFPVDIEICEGLGCQLQLLLSDPASQARWDILTKTLKERKIAEENSSYEWLKGYEKKWVLPRNLILHKKPIEWTTLSELVESKENRVDILKIEPKNNEEHFLFYSMLTNGYRPAIILVNWTVDPDTSSQSMLTAGHLQCSGYKLLASENNWFLYCFTDINIYETCSWNVTKVQNPLVIYFAKYFSSILEENTTEKKNVEDKQEASQ